jgi:hypothetical protein
MSWGNWILAYLFDCVHPHTTWPRRHRAGFTYVSCLDCGRELPYSLERMKIVTRKELMADRKRNVWNRPWHLERYARQGRMSLPHSPEVCGAVIDLFKFSTGRLARSGQEIHWVIEYLQSKPIGEE